MSHWERETVPDEGTNQRNNDDTSNRRRTWTNGSFLKRLARRKAQSALTAPSYIPIYKARLVFNRIYRTTVSLSQNKVFCFSTAVSSSRGRTQKDKTCFQLIHHVWILSVWSRQGHCLRSNTPARFPRGTQLIRPWHTFSWPCPKSVSQKAVQKSDCCLVGLHL